MAPAGSPTTVAALSRVGANDETPQTSDATSSRTDSATTATPSNARVLVVIPTYNEAENIASIVERLRSAAPDLAVLIADDNSPDGTGDIADSLATEDSSIKVLHREGKQGLGAAYIAGFDWAFEHGYNIVVEMDADGSHAPEELPQLLEALADADLVIGSRWVRGGTVRNWPRHRQLLSRLSNVYTRLALGLPTRDATGGFRVYRREVLEVIDWHTVASQGYCFQVDLTWRTFQAGYRIVESPITFTEREQGNSKMSLSIVLEAYWRVTAWGARRRVQQTKGWFARLLRRGRR
ncbi:MAG: polyprenol monophosphomannose synthase [Pseudonocardiaceae bacterium]